MARSRETKIELTAYDDLFQTDESRAEAKLSKIMDIPISEIDEFPDHPFKVLMDEDMEQLVESILACILEPLREEYDYILIDTCPSLNTLTINALAAADEVIIAANPQFWAMVGLEDFLLTVKKIKSRVNSKLDVSGILLTMCEERTNLCKVIYKDLKALEKSIGEGSGESSNLDMFSLEMFENIAFVMAKHADAGIPNTPEEWLDGFNTFSIYQVLPQLIELWGLNVKTDVEAKKNFVRQTVK